MVASSQGRIQKFHLGGGARGTEGAEVERSRREDWGAAGAEGGGVKFFSTLHYKMVLVDSDVLHVLLLTVVVKLETCT